jgi:raffinose/stachyose/melibiose transport system permease protein
VARTKTTDGRAAARPSRGPSGVLARIRARRGETTIRGTELRTAFLFILPAFLVYAVFMLYPFINSIGLSFTDWNGATVAKKFVGFENYLEIPGDPDFITAFKNNLVWLVFGTVVPVAMGLFLALALWSKTRGSLLFRTLLFLPYVIPVVVIGLVWGWIYHPLYGIVNTILETVGLESLTRGWLGDPATALPAVLIAAIWGAFGFVTVVIYAGLQNVDMGTVEAAEVDGANWWQRARHVVIPQIAPVLTLVTAITLIGGFAVIDFIIVMTGGGPGNASEVMGSYAYERGFQSNRVGYGAALSTFITLMTLVAAVIFVRLRERRDDGG